MCYTDGVLDKHVPVFFMGIVVIEQAGISVLTIFYRCNSSMIVSTEWINTWVPWHRLLNTMKVCIN